MPLKDEIEAMNKFGTDSPGTEAPGTEAPGTTAPGTTAPGTEAPGTSAPSTEAPGTEAPSTNAPETVAPTTEAPGDEKSELELLKEQNELLRKQVEEFAGGPKPKPEPETKTAAPTTEAPTEELDFIGGADMEDITGDPKALNTLLNKVYAAGARSSSEKVLKSIPDIVKANALQYSKLSNATTEFYKANEDLIPFKKTVAAIGLELSAEHPDWEIDKLMEEIGKESRSRLALHKKVTSETPTKKPSFAKTPKGSKPKKEKPNLTPVQKEIEEMNRAEE